MFTIDPDRTRTASVTVVAFRTAEQRHYHFRVFKLLEEVLEDDRLLLTPGKT